MTSGRMAADYIGLLGNCEAELAASMRG